MIHEEISEKLKDYFPLPQISGIYELEVRFNYISEDTFDAVFSHFSKNEKTAEESVDFFFGEKRKTLFSDGSEKCIEKTSIFKKQSDFFDYRISLSSEKEVPLTSLSGEEEVSLIREKRRTTFFINNVKLDLTKISTSTPRKNENVSSFEIEVEITFSGGTSFPSLITFEKTIEDVYCAIKDSLLLTIPEEKDIVKRVYSLLNETEGNNFFAQARNIKPKDLISGEVCWNENGLSVSQKADGERRLLCYLPFPMRRGNTTMCVFLLNLNKRGFTVQLKIKTENKEGKEYLIDGEYLKNKKLFLGFDCLYLGGDIRKENYLSRIEKIKPSLEKVTDSSNLLEMREKKIITIFTKSDYLSPEFKDGAMQHFFDCVNIALDMKEDFPNDGLMFTPIECAYSMLINTRSVAILKWKPPEKLTIDFELGNGKKLLSSAGEKKILFTAREYSFLKNVDWESIFSSGAKSGDIIELSPSFDEGNPILRFERFRRDKVKSNNINVARDIWEDITSPINEDIIRGKTLYLVRKYHNAIKRSLFEEVVSLHNKGTNYLIDIGSGKGGDLSKWMKYDKIFCIEPSEENLIEFKRRLRELNFSGDKRKIKIVKYECCTSFYSILEEINRFFDFKRGECNLDISMMLSLSFFWKDETTLNYLSRFIKEITTSFYSATGKETHFVFLTVLGDRMNAVVPPFTERELNDALIINNGKKIFINIKNSIVKDQVEYFVDLPQLLFKTSYSLVSFKSSDSNPFLSENEKIYTSMYGSGIWRSGKDSVYLSPGEVEEIEIDGDTFYLNGVKREKNLTEVLSFFTNLRGYSPEDKSFEEISDKIKREIYFVSPGEEVIVYSPNEEMDEGNSVPIVLYRLPDGVYYAITEKF